MKATEAVCHVAPRFIRATAARQILGGRKVLEDCEAAGWIKPVHRAHKLTLFKLSALHACADRIETQGYPTPQ